MEKFLVPDTCFATKRLVFPDLIPLMRRDGVPGTSWRSLGKDAHRLQDKLVIIYNTLVTTCIQRLASLFFFASF